MGAYDVPLLDRIEANETDGQQAPSYFKNYLCAGCGIHTSQHLAGGWRLGQKDREFKAFLSYPASTKAAWDT